MQTGFRSLFRFPWCLAVENPTDNVFYTVPNALQHPARAFYDRDGCASGHICSPNGSAGDITFPKGVSDPLYLVQGSGYGNLRHVGTGARRLVIVANANTRRVRLTHSLRHDDPGDLFCWIDIAVLKADVQVLGLRR